MESTQQRIAAVVERRIQVQRARVLQAHLAHVMAEIAPHRDRGRGEDPGRVELLAKTGEGLGDVERRAVQHETPPPALEPADFRGRSGAVETIEQQLQLCAARAAGVDALAGTGQRIQCRAQVRDRLVQCLQAVTQFLALQHGMPGTPLRQVFRDQRAQPVQRRATRSDALAHRRQATGLLSALEQDVAAQLADPAGAQ